jgi:2-methylcitrate dehydratase
MAELSVTQKLARLAMSTSYDAISPEARDMAKRLIIDALACGVGGYKSATGRAAHAYAKRFAEPGEATLIGSGVRVPCSTAIIANQAMIRYLDYNDDLPIPIGPGDLVAAHPSGSLPVALTLAEARKVTGRALLEAMVAGYEVTGRLLAGFKVSLEVRGAHHGSTLLYSAVAMAGRLLGLSSDQIAHGMGIGGSISIGLDILDAEGEEYTMAKNLADGMISERGYTAALLAASGFTGPLRIIEGNKGFAQVVLGGHHMFGWPNEGREWILNTVIKALPAEATTHGHVTATCRLVREHHLTPDMIERIVVRTNKRTVHHTGDPVKKYPQNKETADHSSYFLTAMAVLEGAITPKIYIEHNFTDPRVRAIIDKVDLEYGPEFDDIIPAGQVTMHLKDGRSVTKRIERHDLAGEPSNRMTDAALRAKFLECAAGVLPDARADQIIETCLTLEKLDDVSPLMPMAREIPCGYR